MIDIMSITTGLKLGEDEIWYSTEAENISYPPEGHQACLAVEENSFWFRHRNNCIISIVKAYPPQSNRTIFDIGGGNGFVSLGLANSGFDVALVEPRVDGPSNAKSRGIKSVICATTTTAKFKKKSLPAVGLFDVVEHIEDDLNFMKSINGLMEKDGYLYLTVPAYSFLWSDNDASAGHFRRYTVESISDLLNNAGFQVVFSSYFFRFLPLPIFLLRSLRYRLGLKKKEKNINISRDHVTKGGLMKKILDSALRQEIEKLSKKNSMMFGGSCLLVAKSS